MGDVLTVGEMESQFLSEWVLVGDPETDDSLRMQSGKVIYHSEDRDEVYRKAIELRPKRFAMLYTEPFPKIPQLFYEFCLRFSPGAHPRASGDTWVLSS